MNDQPFAVTPGDYKPALHVMGDSIHVLATLATTGVYAMTLVHGREGNGPPPHSHPWSESFFVIRGRVEFDIDDKTSLAVPGTLVHFPAGSVHSFRFRAGGADLLEITGPGSRAVEMFTDFDSEIPADGTDDPKTIAVLERNGVRLG